MAVENLENDNGGGEDFLGNLDIETEVELETGIDDGDGGEGDDKGDESLDTLRKSLEDSFAVSEKPSKKEEKPTRQALEIGDENFFAGNVDDLEDLVKSPKDFNKLLNGIYKKAVENAHSLAMENFLRSAPDVVKNQVVQQITLQTTVKKFYDDNEDLAPYKKTVGAIANLVASKAPDKSLSEILKVTEQIARKRLQLVKKATDKEKDKGGSPKFPRKPQGGRKSAGGEEDQPKGMSKDIDDMLAALGK